MTEHDERRKVYCVLKRRWSQLDQSIGGLNKLLQNQPELRIRAEQLSCSSKQLYELLRKIK